MQLNMNNGTTAVMTLPITEHQLDFPGLQEGMVVAMFADRGIIAEGPGVGNFYYQTVRYQYVEGLAPADWNQADVGVLVNGIANLPANMFVVAIPDNAPAALANVLFAHFLQIVGVDHNLANVRVIITFQHNSYLRRSPDFPGLESSDDDEGKE